MTHQEKKAIVFNRDKNQCKKCHRREQLTLDHVIPKSAGGSDDIDNLQTLCMGCNIMKADKPHWRTRLYNWLFSHKTIYEFKNEIKLYVSHGIGQLRAQFQRVIDNITASIDELARVRDMQNAMLINQKKRIEHLERQAREAETMTEHFKLRIKAMEEYHGIEFYREYIPEQITPSVIIKEYRKIKKKKTKP